MHRLLTVFGKLIEATTSEHLHTDVTLEFKESVRKKSPFIDTCIVKRYESIFCLTALEEVDNLVTLDETEYWIGCRDENMELVGNTNIIPGAFRVAFSPQSLSDQQITEKGHYKKYIPDLRLVRTDTSGSPSPGHIRVAGGRPVVLIENLISEIVSRIEKTCQMRVTQKGKTIIRSRLAEVFGEGVIFIDASCLLKVEPMISADRERGVFSSLHSYGGLREESALRQISIQILIDEK